MSVTLIGLGMLFFLLTLGFAFTIFGEIFALLGAACIGAGVMRLVLGARRQRTR